MPKQQVQKSITLLSDKNRTAIRKAFRAGRRTISIDSVRFNIEKAPGRGGEPFILVTPVNGMLPMAQVEIYNLGSSKLEHVKESLKRTKRR